MKFLSPYLNKNTFFKELKEDEIFMYSYHDYTWEDVLKFAEESMVNVALLDKSSEEYRRYGECAAKVVNKRTTVFCFRINTEELIEIESQSEVEAKIKLMHILFERGYAKLDTIK